MSGLQISGVETSALDALQNPFDLFLCACGFESRSTALASLLFNYAKKVVAVGFSVNQVLKYESNKAWFGANKCDLYEPNDSEFRSIIDKALESFGCVDRPVHIVVDVSCFNRLRLAHIVDALRCLNCEDLEVSYIYSLAEYSPPIEDVAPTTVAEPVTSEFAGWRTSPEKPSAAVLGLGYESGRSIGIIDYLEINNASWAYSPRSPIVEYAHAIEAANEALIEPLSVEGRISFYDVLAPAEVFREMNTLVLLLKRTLNPILIPFGPKIFALISLLVACNHPEVGVWRVSGGTRETPVDRLASPYTAVLRVNYSLR